MKLKYYLASIFITAFVIANAQTKENIPTISKNALGVRIPGGFSGNNGDLGVEFSWQHKLCAKNRLEADLGFNGFRSNEAAYGAALTYQWCWNIYNGLNWYVGPSISTLYKKREGKNYAIFRIGGQAGLEYNFNHLKVPLQTSLDFRPMWNMLGNYNSSNEYGIALGIRYTF